MEGFSYFWNCYLRLVLHIRILVFENILVVCLKPLLSISREVAKIEINSMSFHVLACIVCCACNFFLEL